MSPHMKQAMIDDLMDEIDAVIENVSEVEGQCCLCCCCYKDF